jgi:hypothetical protein
METGKQLLPIGLPPKFKRISIGGVAISMFSIFVTVIANPS